MPNVTPEDLVRTVIAADDLRRKARGQTSTRAALFLGQNKPSPERRFIEPFFNLLGILMGQGMELLPVFLRRPMIQWVNAAMGSYKPGPTLELPARIQETVQMARELQQKTGQWPAFLILTSHPETEGSLQWLRFELMRQGLQIADAVVEAHEPGKWYPRHPKCFLAIDPFALDTVSTPIGAFYAAWMHWIYQAWDRQPSTQSWIQRHLLLRKSDYRHVGWRLLRSLKDDTPVLMVLAGGLPYNARLLYAAREFAQRLPIPRWRIAKRQAQKELMEILMTPEGDIWPADRGEIPPGKQATIRSAFLRWGLSADQVESALHELQEEFKRPIPFRERLFKVLRGRLTAKGKPLMLVAINHVDTAPYVRISPPIEILAGADPKAQAAAFARFFDNL